MELGFNSHVYYIKQFLSSNYNFICDKQSCIPFVKLTISSKFLLSLTFFISISLYVKYFEKYFFLHIFQ